MALHTIATSREAFHEMFECPHCELEVGATVYASSSGTARGIGAAAEETALRNAELDGNALASRTLQFVRCPRCGKTDPSGASYRIQAMVGAVLLGALAAGLVYLFTTMQMSRRGDADVARWVSLGFGVFIVLLLHWKWGRPWRSPDARTVFQLDPRE